MYIEVTKAMFKNEFKSIRPDNFSYDGLSALYEWFTDLEEQTGEPMELDVIAICCDFNEEPLADVLENYGLESLEELHENTIVVAELDNGNVIYQAF